MFRIDKKFSFGRKEMIKTYSIKSRITFRGTAVMRNKNMEVTSNEKNCLQIEALKNYPIDVETQKVSIEKSLPIPRSIPFQSGESSCSLEIRAFNSLEITKIEENSLLWGQIERFSKGVGQFFTVFVSVTQGLIKAKTSGGTFCLVRDRIGNHFGVTSLHNLTSHSLFKYKRFDFFSFNVQDKKEMFLACVKELTRKYFDKSQDHILQNFGDELTQLCFSSNFPILEASVNEKFLNIRSSWLKTVKEPKFFVDPVFGIKPTPACDIIFFDLPPTLPPDVHFFEVFLPNAKNIILNETFFLISYQMTENKINFNGNDYNRTLNLTKNVSRKDIPKLEMSYFLNSNKSISLINIVKFEENLFVYDGSMTTGSSGAPIISKDGLIMGFSFGYLSDSLRADKIKIRQKLHKLEEDLMFSLVDTKEMKENYKVSKNSAGNLAISGTHQCINQFFSCLEENLFKTFEFQDCEKKKESVGIKSRLRSRSHSKSKFKSKEKVPLKATNI